MQSKYYEPLFYISTDKMPFNIRVEMTLTETVDGNILDKAVQTAARRYPYFTIKVEKSGEEYITVPNDRPIRVYKDDVLFPLGSEEVNRHFVAASYKERDIYFMVSHVITDGAGFYPFVKTVLYYYLCEKLGTELDPTGVNLVGSELFADEAGNPYPEEKMQGSQPLYVKRLPDYFRLCDGKYAAESSERCIYRFKVSEKELMDFNYDNDGSPCAMISSLTAKAIMNLHPENKKNIISAISFNLRPGLGNKHGFRMLCSSILVDYPNKMRDYSVHRLCTCTRGTVSLQSQPENVIYYASQRKARFEHMSQFKTLEDKKRVMGEKALLDSIDNTFSVSYVGRMDYGAMTPYIEQTYNITDGSTYKTVFLEMSQTNGYFNIAMQQGFDTDVYYKEVCRLLRENNVTVIEEGKTPFRIPVTVLP